MKYIIEKPLRFLWFTILTIGSFILTAVISLMLIIWDFDLKWYRIVAEFFFDYDNFYTGHDSDSKQYSYKTFWDAVHNRKS